MKQTMKTSSGKLAVGFYGVTEGRINYLCLLKSVRISRFSTMRKRRNLKMAHSFRENGGKLHIDTPLFV